MVLSSLLSAKSSSLWRYSTITPPNHTPQPTIPSSSIPISTSKRSTKPSSYPSTSTTTTNSSKQLLSLSPTSISTPTTHKLIPKTNPIPKRPNSNHQNGNKAPVAIDDVVMDHALMLMELYNQDKESRLSSSSSTPTSSPNATEQTPPFSTSSPPQPLPSSMVFSCCIIVSQLFLDRPLCSPSTEWCKSEGSWGNFEGCVTHIIELATRKGIPIISSSFDESTKPCPHTPTPSPVTSPLHTPRGDESTSKKKALEDLEEFQSINNEILSMTLQKVGEELSLDDEENEHSILLVDDSDNDEEEYQNLSCASSLNSDVASTGSTPASPSIHFGTSLPLYGFNVSTPPTQTSHSPWSFGSKSIPLVLFNDI
eukprot:TRINITY_DN1138_c0_g1_i6.p1 TRINITY_DN1138_c0_g1~~TRINITY_DN1138_c0_g1_i6.p1  ORF type:complete len:368 (+),score=82.72 TRINITY_DN1138_c0_g1_i6:383-1486(+)